LIDRVKKRLCIGKDEEGHRITLELEIETKKLEPIKTIDDRTRPHTRRTVDGRELSEYKTLSIVGESLRSAGQMQDDIRENMDKYTLYIPKDRLVRILDIWDTWHLNDMNSACEHQTALGWKYDDHHNKETFKGDPCPTCGYEIGSAWLLRELPENVEREILELFTPVNANSESEESEYERAATEFIVKHNLKIAIKPLHSGREPSWKPHGLGYRVTIIKPNKTRLVFPFWDTVANMHEGRRPTKHSVLACVSSDGGYGTTPEEVIEELGDMPLKQARATARFAEKIQNFFTETELEDLRQIS